MLTYDKKSIEINIQSFFPNFQWVVVKLIKKIIKRFKISTTFVVENIY